MNKPVRMEEENNVTGHSTLEKHGEIGASTSNRNNMDGFTTPPPNKTAKISNEKIIKGTTTTTTDKFGILGETNMETE